MRFSITMAAASAILFSFASPAVARSASSYNLARRADEVTNGTVSDNAYTANITNVTSSNGIFNATNSTQEYEEYEDCDDDEDMTPSAGLNSTAPVSTSVSTPLQSAAAGTGEDDEDCEEYVEEDDTAVDDDECEDEDAQDGNETGAAAAKASAAKASTAPSSIVSDKVLAGAIPAASAAPSPSAFYSASNAASDPATPAEGQSNNAAEEGCGQVSRESSSRANTRLPPSTPP